MNTFYIIINNENPKMISITQKEEEFVKASLEDEATVILVEIEDPKPRFIIV